MKRLLNFLHIKRLNFQHIHSLNFLLLETLLAPVVARTLLCIKGKSATTHVPFVLKLLQRELRLVVCAKLYVRVCRLAFMDCNRRVYDLLSFFCRLVILFTSRCTWDLRAWTVDRAIILDPYLLAAVCRESLSQPCRLFFCCYGLLPCYLLCRCLSLIRYAPAYFSCRLVAICRGVSCSFLIVGENFWWD